jgi:CBS domain-containing protein
MATVRDILVNKGTLILTIGPDTSVYQAATQMNEHKVGCLVVADGDRLIGIFTERDILQRVVAQRRDVDQTPVREVMTTEVACCYPHTTIEEARGVMKNRRIRHLPVIDNDERIQGMISIGDLNAFQNNHQELTIHLLEQYIYGQT